MPSSAGPGRCSTVTIRAERSRVPAAHGAAARGGAPAHLDVAPGRLDLNRLSQDWLQPVPGPRSGRHASLPHAAGNRCPTCSGAVSGIRWHPGMFTLETSRRGVGVLAAYANLQLFGRVGFRVLLAHLVEMVEALREHRDGHVSTTVPNDAGGHSDRLPGISGRRRHLDHQGPRAHRPGRRVRRCCATTTAPVEPNENARPWKLPAHQRQQPRQQPDRPVGGDRLAVPQQRRAQILLGFAVKAQEGPQRQVAPVVVEAAAADHARRVPGGEAAPSRNTCLRTCKRRQAGCSMTTSST